MNRIQKEQALHEARMWILRGKDKLRAAANFLEQLNKYQGDPVVLFRSDYDRKEFGRSLDRLEVELRRLQQREAVEGETIKSPIGLPAYVATGDSDGNVPKPESIAPEQHQI